jgi:hypothetical protein
MPLSYGKGPSRITQPLLASIADAVDAQRKVATVTAATYTISNPFNVACAPGAGLTSQAISLPPITDALLGDAEPITITDAAGTAATKPIYISAGSGFTINGSTNLTLSTDNGSFTVKPVTSTRWAIVSVYP